MPRYFFNVHDDTDYPDQLGEELPDVAAAWKEGALVAAEMIRDHLRRLQPGQEWRLEISDQSGALLYVISLNIERAAR
jgi:hypothetical protein